MNETIEGKAGSPHEISEQDKTRFFSDFALNMKNDFRMLKMGGILGLEAKREGWRNVSEHCLVEAVEAEILAGKLGIDPERLKKAALIHDWYKRRERELTDVVGATAYDASISEDERQLKEMGYSDDIIKVSKSVGHSALKRMQEPDITLEEQLMHYIDAITTGSDIVPLDERIDKNEANPKYRELNEQGRLLFNGKTYFEVQREVGKKIQAHLAEKLGLDDPDELPNYIKQEIQKHIIEHNQ